MKELTLQDFDAKSRMIAFHWHQAHQQTSQLSMGAWSKNPKNAQYCVVQLHKLNFSLTTSEFRQTSLELEDYLHAMPPVSSAAPSFPLHPIHLSQHWHPYSYKIDLKITTKRKIENWKLIHIKRKLLLCWQLVLEISFIHYSPF